MSAIPTEVADRMAALVRKIADIHRRSDPSPGEFADQLAEVRAIVALLPVPVDPDMVEAREVVCGYHHDLHPESVWHVGQAELVRSGASDKMLDVQAAYHGIKRGRFLQAGVSS